MIYCRCMRPILNLEADSLSFMEDKVVGQFSSKCGLCGAEHRVDVEIDMAHIRQLMAEKLDEAIKEMDFYLKGAK